MNNLRRLLVSIPLRLLQLIIKRKNNYYAFGSWRGEYYIDNSRYLFEYVREHDSKATLIWIGNKNVEKRIQKSRNVKVLKKNSLVSMLYLMKCKYMFCSQMHFDDLCDYNVYIDAIITYLHHGMPVKKWGADSVNGHSVYSSSSKIKNIARNIIGSDIEYQYFVTSSRNHELTNLTALDYRGCTPEKNLQTGTPRNDMFFVLSDTQIKRLKTKYAKQLGFDSKKKVIMYLPTFRRSGKQTRSFSTGLDVKDIDALRSVLISNDAVLIEKNHIVEDYSSKINTNEDSVLEGLVIHADQNVNVQEMLCFADILISDYSGAFLDYLLLDRPIIHYAYDYEEYKTADSGLYYEIEDFAAGPVVETLSELLVCIQNAFDNPSVFSKKRNEIKNKYMEYEDGHASERIYKRVICQQRGFENE